MGYNWQTSWVVYGVEADMAAVDARGTSTVSDGVTTWAMKDKLYSLGTLRARLGVGAGPVLLYATGGFAWGLAQTENAVYCVGCAASPWSHGIGSSSHLGAIGGGGLEWLATEHLVFRAEYLAADLGSGQHSIKGTTADPALRPGTPQYTYNWDAADPTLNSQMWRVGFAAKFN